MSEFLPFTLPEQIRPFCRSHQCFAYETLFKAKFKAAMEKNTMLPLIDPLAWQVSSNINCKAVGDGQASLTIG